MSQRKHLTEADLLDIRSALAAKNPAWDKALTDADLESMAEDALDDCSVTCPPDQLRRSVVRIATRVIAEAGLAEE